jgi:iron complex transport system ATP-binding protein
MIERGAIDRQSPAGASEVVRFDAVSVQRSSHGFTRTLLDRVDWSVCAGEHWGILGPNGAGKTTLVRVASAQMRPSAGGAFVFGHRLGGVPLQRLRSQIGLVEPAIGRRFPPERTVLEVVLTGLGGTVLPVGEYNADDRERAHNALSLVAAGRVAERSFASCSEGERSRVLLARALVTDASLLVLDEPAAGLDLAGRELLLEAFGAAVSRRPGLATLTVTHHIEDLPAATSHALLLREGRVVAAGPLGDSLDDRTLSACFGLPLRLERIDGRLFPHARHDRSDAPAAVVGATKTPDSTAPSGTLAEAEHL